MSQPSETLDIRHFLNAHLADVFETMLSLKVEPADGDSLPGFSGRVTGSVGLGGEKANGALYLHLSGTFAQQIAGTMLGIAPGENPGEADVNDVIGELTNMLAGGLKSALCDSGAHCAVSTPAIIRGAEFQIETIPDVRRELLLFNCAENPVAVEVHVKFN